MEIKKNRAVPYQDFIHRAYPELEEKGMIVKNITFVVTEECNLRCSYCYEGHKNNKNKMIYETGKKIVDYLFQLNAKEKGYINSKNSKFLILEFIGGEPLLEIELIDKIVEYFKFKAVNTDHPWKINYMIAISTNGILYNDHKVVSFMNRNKGRVSLTITIDGNKELHDSCRKFPDGKGSYDIVEKAFIKHSKILGLKDTKLTLSPDNIHYLYEASIHLYTKLNLEYIFANCIFEKGWEVDHAKIMYEQLIKLSDWLLEDERYTKYSIALLSEDIGKPLTEDNNWCGGNGQMLAIASNGDLYPCLRYVPFATNGKREPMKIGSIDEGICHSKEQKDKIKCLQCIDRKSQSTDECYNCPIASGCAWCTAYNYEETGSPDKRVTYICIMHKARVLADVYYWNKLYRKEGMKERFNMNIPKEWALEIINEEEYNMLLDLSKEK